MYFADNDRKVIEAYVENGEGIDRAGGFAIQVGLWHTGQTLSNRASQGLGSLLIRKVDGDYSNVVGFPVASFYKLLEKLHEEEDVPDVERGWTLPMRFGSPASKAYIEFLKSELEAATTGKGGYLIDGKQV